MAAMYLPPRFRIADPALAAALIREQPLASLITLDESGLPFVTHLPLHRPPDADAAAPNLQRLLGHLARGNP